jgi:uncharacterized protein
MIKTAISNFESEYSRMNKILAEISNDQLFNEISVGKNRGIYLLGHLTSVNDGIRTLLNLGDKLYPQLAPIFVSAPDKSVPNLPEPNQLREMWTIVMDKTIFDIKTLSDAAWLDKHTAVSEEDFKKEPNRNKLSILLSRTIHQTYHAGQLAMLIKKQPHTDLQKPPVPPFTFETAIQKVQMAEDAWNTKNPEKVSLAYTVDTEWRNRHLFINGRDEVRSFLAAKWEKELAYKLKKELWAFSDYKIAVRFEYEWHDLQGQWYRSYGNENWEFDENGLMKKRFASINDVKIEASERKL